MIWILLLLMTCTAVPQVYDLDSFIKLVQKNSKDLKTAQKDLEMADARYQEALSTALPKINAQATYNRNLGKMFLYVDFPDFDTGEVTKQKFQISYNNDFSATVMPCALPISMNS